jgi:hypothetical protein
MNLLEIRKEFVKRSGRFDLVTDAATFGDNGANHFINEGIHFLERLAEVPEANARLFFELAAGEYAITFQHKCRVIGEVWANDSEQRYQLTKVPFNEFKSTFSSPASEASSNYPAYFTLASLRALETTAKNSLATFIDKSWDETDKKYDYRGIVIAPPADKTYTIEINGIFKQVNLSSNTDENYWTIEEPNLVIRAALYKLESTTRGSADAKHWLETIKLDIIEIDKDFVAEQVFNVNKMEG